MAADHVLLTAHGGFDIIVDREAVVYVEPSKDGGARLYVNSGGNSRIMEVHVRDTLHQIFPDVYNLQTPEASDAPR